MATVSIQYSDGSAVSWGVTDEQADKADYDLRILLGQPDAIFARAKDIERYIQRGDT
jgi:hypothetical protein